MVYIDSTLKLDRSPVAFRRVEHDLNCAAKILPRFPEDADFKAPLGGKLEEVEPLVVRLFGGI